MPAVRIKIELLTTRILYLFYTRSFHCQACIFDALKCTSNAGDRAVWYQTVLYGKVE